MSTLLWNHFNLNPETFRALRLTPNHSPVWVNPTVLTKSDPRGHSGLEEKKVSFFFLGKGQDILSLKAIQVHICP